MSSVLVLAACGDEPAIDMETVDENKSISRKNANLNATGYMKQVHGTDAVRVVIDSDSTIDTSCRYGDGWASGTVTLKDGSNVAIKCQTTGSGNGVNGCLTQEDFLTKDYAEQDGHCDRSIESLKKLGG